MREGDLGGLFEGSVSFSQCIGTIPVDDLIEKHVGFVRMLGGFSQTLLKLSVMYLRGVETENCASVAKGGEKVEGGNDGLMFRKLSLRLFQDIFRYLHDLEGIVSSTGTST